ncbi:nitrate ABC transporter substrate-binding protein [Microbacterium dextranolyticum]|uniref:nitrate ABC transporter substrate-binding protein n=1 Tax=Microbacterium dextranolyticum TaxID=36806 RepID=UPI0019585327|nr:nitrate ABC transporter substrate-binding protein [Microbacterium dextranolyticum]MBM7463204.1 hypothetical protein [Microbacterium dextranolyticum]
MRAQRPRFAAAATAACLAVLLTGCAGTAATTPTEVVGTGAVTTAPAAPVAEPSPSGSPLDVTCDSIIGDDLRAEFAAQKWTSKKTPFAAGGVTLDDGLLCTWANYAVPSGNLMMFGWAPITSDQAAKMQSGLESKGWLRKDIAGVLYITEDPNQTPTVDADGFGMTYQFGDGWVTVADVKQNLLLIQRPQS